MTATPQDVLREAARILTEEDCWAQAGGGHKPEPGVRPRRAVTAIAEARRRLNGLSAVAPQKRLVAFLAAEGVLSGVTVLDDIVRWNDAPERTAEDVILALKRAAEEAP